MTASEQAPPAPDESLNRPLPPPAARYWRTAALAPLLLAVPWVLLTRDLGAPPALATLAGMLLVLLLGVTTLTDLLFHRVFNWTTYTAVAWVFALQLVALLASDRPLTLPAIFRGEARAASISALIGLPSPFDSLLGLLLAFGIMFLLYVVFRGGGGDLKLVTALGALLGTGHVLPLIAYTYILAGVFAACYIVWKLGAGPRDPKAPLLRRKIPMALFIALGTVAALCWPF